MWLIVIMLISMINICIYGKIRIITEKIQNISLYGVGKFTGFFNSVVDLRGLSFPRNRGGMKKLGPGS